MPSRDGASPDDRSPGADDATASGASGGERSDGDAPPASGPIVAPGGRREVEVPPSLFRVVTVFSTLVAIVLVVLGFALLGSASSIVTNPTGSLLVRLLGLVVPQQVLVEGKGTIGALVGLVGLATIAGGAAVYVYGTRFRAPGMGNSKDASDEDSDDG